LNRYAYVAGNPETATDPTGHRIACGADDGCGGGGGTGSGTGSGGTGSGGGTGGSGKGGKDGGKDPTGTGPCADPGSQQCTDYKAWEFDQQNLRDSKLASLLTQAKLFLLAGGLLDLVVDVLAFIFNKSTEARLEAILDLASNATLLLQYIPAAGSDESMLLHGVAIFQWLGGVAHTALIALHALGVLGRAAVDVAVNTISAATEGMPAILMGVVSAIVGPIATNALTGFAHLLIGNGMELMAEYHDQESESIASWCAERTVCAPVPSGT
ncbi:MAG TPA: hypothetical protein VIC85_01490, partial [Ktedonobacterales bacterium]